MIEYRIDRITHRGDGMIDVLYTQGTPPLAPPNFKHVREFTSLKALKAELLLLEEGPIDPVLFAAAAALSTDRNLKADIADKSVTFDFAAGSATCRV